MKRIQKSKGKMKKWRSEIGYGFCSFRVSVVYAQMHLGKPLA
jgi:hypothetical protein